MTRDEAIHDAWTHRSPVADTTLYTLPLVRFRDGWAAGEAWAAAELERMAADYDALAEAYPSGHTWIMLEKATVMRDAARQLRESSAAPAENRAGGHASNP